MSKSEVSIFVSRVLDSNSELRIFSESISVEIDAYSLIEFTQLPFNLPKDEWLFFYSKSGVSFFFNQLAPEVDLNRYKFTSFGPSTGKYIESKIGRPIDYYGDADSKVVSSSLIEVIGMDSICFVVGKHSLRSVQSFLPSTISSNEIVVYDNQPLTSLSLRHYNIAILTSPMNAATFIGSGGSADHYISIGSTTSEAMAKLNLHPVQSLHPSERGLLGILKSIYKDYYAMPK